MEWLASLFFKVGLGALGDSFFKPFLAHLDTAAKIDADKFKAATGAERDVVIAQTQANSAAFHEQREEAKARWGHWSTKLLIFCAAFPPIMHSGAVYLDSIPFPYLAWQTWWFAVQTHVQGSWAVARAPGVYEGQELTIIAAVVGYQLGQTAIGGLIGRFSRK
jgi:hypothetical protein